MSDRYQEANMLAMLEGWKQGIEDVASMISKKADAYAIEFGENDMGSLSFGRGPQAEAKRDYHSSLLDLEYKVRAMLSTRRTPLHDVLLLAAINALAEVLIAEKKFPTWPTDPLHAVSVLGEEFGELTKAALQLSYEPYKTTKEEVRIEAIQTAAMALRFIVSLDAYKYVPSNQHSQRLASEEADNV